MEFVCKFCNKKFKTAINLEKHHKKTSKFCLKKQSKIEQDREIVIEDDDKNSDDTVLKKNLEINAILESILLGQEEISKRIKIFEDLNTSLSEEAPLNQKETNETNQINQINQPTQPTQPYTKTEEVIIDIGKEPKSKNRHISYLEEVKNKIKDHIAFISTDNKFETKNYLYTVIELMKFIENFYISNNEKKKLLADGLDIYIDNNEDIDETSKDIFKNITYSFIDIAISIDNKEIFIKEKKGNCCML
jgi:hypothetical protein